MRRSPMAHLRDGAALFWESLREGERDYTRGSLRQGLVLLAIPMMLEMLMESVFALADVYFVSRIGTVEVAVVGITEALLTIIYSLAMGIGIAATAMVSRRIGEGDPDLAAREGAQAIWLSVLLSFGIAGVGLACPAESLRLMGADAETARAGTGYARVMLASNLVIVLLFVNNAILRGAGDASVAMRSLWLANGLNLVLDPCLIFGLGPIPAMGLEGAAWATVIGRGSAVLYQFWKLRRGSGHLRMRAHHLPIQSRRLGQMARVSVGGMGQLLVETASWVVLTRILATFGSAGLAGYTVGTRLLMFALMPAWGMASAAATLVGQNLGAKRPDRAEQSVYIAGKFNTGFLGIVGIICWIYARPMAGWFTSEPDVESVAANCLRIIATGYVFYAWQMVLVAAFNGASDTRTPALINIAFFWFIKLPLAYFLAVTSGLTQNGVFYAITAAYCLATVAAWVFFRRGRWKTRELPGPELAESA